MGDQAAGLRRWAEAHKASEEAPATDEASSVDASASRGVVRDQAIAETASRERTGAPDGKTESPAQEIETQEVEAQEVESESVSAPDATSRIPLMVLGLPTGASTERAQAALKAWARQGQRWIGDPGVWHLMACDAESPQLARLARQQPRWALWIDTDGDGFRQAFRVMQAVQQGGGPRRLLALHPPVTSRRGLLNNLQQVARQAFGIELLVVAP
ncbi:hypothetical protein [Halomonas sp. YLGW01]|uniref:hypothetical protein n=1 Tax=Halomonas sp. YLGW01 TaxID=2773308 RepID=UPI00177A9570|nr:hypothetical protein [Halomonas sp. YLGW01]